MIVAQQTEDSVEEADGMMLLPCAATGRISANVGSLDFGQDSVQGSGRRIAQAGEVAVFQIQEMTG